MSSSLSFSFFFFQAEDGIRDHCVTGVQTCALPISGHSRSPRAGLRLDRFEMPQGEGLRVETGYAQGCSVTPFYDPMVAKLVAHGSDRTQAIARLRQALAQTDRKSVV